MQGAPREWSRSRCNQTWGKPHKPYFSSFLLLFFLFALFLKMILIILEGFKARLTSAADIGDCHRHELSIKLYKKQAYLKSLIFNATFLLGGGERLEFMISKELVEMK